MLRMGEEESIVAGTWQLDCVEMTLAQSRASDAEVFKGPGWIKFNSDGDLVFKLLGAHCGLGEQLAPGLLVPDESYFELTVVDEWGREWTAHRLRPPRSLFGTHMLGTIHRLRHVARSKYTGSSLRCIVPEPIEFPCNMRVKKTTQIKDSVVAQEDGLEAAEFSALGHGFRLIKRDTSTTLLVTPDAGNSLDARLDLVAGDGLQYVLARPIEWVLVNHYDEGRFRVEVRSRKVAPRRGHWQPLEATWEHTADVWRLCALFMAFIAPGTHDKRHPLAAWLYDILDAEVASINAHAITLAIAIEGVLTSEYHDIAHPHPDLAGQRELALSALRNAGLQDWFRERAVGAIERTGDVRARDRLESLAKTGLITMAQVRDWQKLRNSVAHASRGSREHLQKLVDRVARARVLFNHLVFGKIGYRGKYTDYEDPETWESRDYSPRNASEEPTPV